MDEKENIAFRFREPLIICAAAKVFTWAVLIVCTALVWGTHHFGTTIKHTVINWDAIWYLKIVMEGYNDPRKTAFFPLLPAAIKIFSYFIKDTAWAGIIISNVASFFSAIFLYNLTLKFSTKKAAMYACAILGAAPTAVFFVSIYTEPFFLALSCAFFISLFSKKWFSAALLAAFASACRLTGLFLILPFAAAYLTQRMENDGRWKIIVYTAVMLSGTGAYAFFLYLNTGDPFIFIRSQAALWNSRTAIVMPFSIYIKNLGDFFSVISGFNPQKTALSSVYFTAAIVFLIIGGLSIRKYGFENILYLGLFTIFLSTQPTTMSYSRYLASVPQFWIIPAVYLSEKKLPKAAFLAVISALLAWQVLINLRWIAGFWVA
jgi:hypothetical protein